MEMNVCNANTNWLRGEHDCTKDSKKTTKRERKIKNDLESRLRLGCIHNEHTCTCFVMWFVLVLFMITYNQIKKKYRAGKMLHFPSISHLCSVWFHHLQPGGDGVCMCVCVCVHMHEQKEACVFERTIRSCGLTNECLYKRADRRRSVWVCACMCMCVCAQGHPRQWEGPGDGPASSASSWWLMLAGPTRPNRPAKLKAYFVKL